MTVAGAPLASAAEQNSAYAQNKEGRFGKPGRPSLFITAVGFNRINTINRIRKVAVAGPATVQFGRSDNLLLVRRRQPET